MKYNRINIIGLGNVLYGDEGFGVAALNSMQESATFPDSVHFIDGGTQGIYLLDYIESCDAVIVFDALIPLDYDRQVYVYRNEELPAFIHRKMSSHQMGFSEMLGIAKLHGKMPKEIVLIGVPPKDLELNIGLSPEISLLLPLAVEEGTAIVNRWLQEGVEIHD
ncbi:MAG: HyaD/HybD family hydrogenase maturation endopeptidase [Chlorobiales bacterium]|nr:HyaD/HybD family hydrogenase maturation endopeptidase [Chlorobiales bacterium]